MSTVRKGSQRRYGVADQRNMVAATPTTELTRALPDRMLAGDLDRGP